MGTSRRAKALAFLGIAQRAGAVVKGTDATRRAIRKGLVSLVLLAEDGSETQLKKVLPLAGARGVTCKRVGDRAELGSAVGSGPLTMVGITALGFAEELENRLGRD